MAKVEYINLYFIKENSETEHAMPKSTTYIEYLEEYPDVTQNIFMVHILHRRIKGDINPMTT